VILVDTSVWIGLLNRNMGRDVSADGVLRFVTCGPIAQEVLQGLREGPGTDAFRASFSALPRLSDPLPFSTFLEAADIYSHGRRKGYTIRSSTDCLIAVIAIENNVPVWHKDRDFNAIARFTRLRAYDRPGLTLL
jgi:predicted nucleic acid-binding protein